MNNVIGIVGSGMIGAQVARLATAAGLDVAICNSRGPETLADLVAELGPRSHALTSAEVVKSADLIVLAIPFAGYAQLSADDFRGKIVVDTMNYYPERDGIMPEVKTDMIATSELVQRHLAKAHVVRALNNVDFVRLFSRARPAGACDRSALPIAADDILVKAAVASVLDTLGYDAVDMGQLSESWRSEPTMPVYVLPYLGHIPSGLPADEARSWFLQAPGEAVSAEAVESLIGQAVRHDKMFGDVRPLTGASL